MKIKNPIVVYNAESNTEAILIQQFLEGHGVEANAIEDNSLVGYSMLGALPGIHKPQVWVDKKDAERVAPLLQQFEETKQSRDAQRQSDEVKSIDVICDDCGATTTFAGSLAGTVQDCSRCAAYMDVGELEWPFGEDFGEPES